MATTSLLYPSDNKRSSAVDHSFADSSERKKKGSNEVESVLNRSLQNENELLRCQLNDLISREKNQRVELQRLRQHRDTEVASLVLAGTVQLKTEVDRLKSMLKSTSGQLLQALTEKEQAREQMEQCTIALEEAKQSATAQETHLRQRLQCLEETLSTSANTAASMADAVDAFQRHVLPTFKPAGFEMAKTQSSIHSPDVAEGKAFVEQLSRLENSLALLRVIVDAKNDTLILIRGKLKEENEELRAELQAFHGTNQDVSQPRDSNFTSPPLNGDPSSHEIILLRQELHSLQSLFNEEVKQLKSKLQLYESEEQQGQGRLIEVQRELSDMQAKLALVEESKSLLEASLKEETSARSQLVSQLFVLRKDNEKTKAELETLKFSQKFLVRQPRSGRTPVQKMDLADTVNQLLSELDKIKGEKVALEEELKNQRWIQVKDHVQKRVSSRDVEMAASDRVGDAELTSKLARARFQQLGLQNDVRSSRLMPNARANHSDRTLLPSAREPYNMEPKSTLPSSSSSTLTSTSLSSSSSSSSSSVQAYSTRQDMLLPSRDEILKCAALYANNLPTKAL